LKRRLISAGMTVCPLEVIVLCMVLSRMNCLFLKMVIQTLV